MSLSFIRPLNIILTLKAEIEEACPFGLVETFNTMTSMIRLGIWGRDEAVL